MKLFIEVVNHLASKYYGNGGWTSITRLPASWLNLQVLGKMCISKIFQNTNPKSIKHLVSPFRSHPKAPGQAIPLRKYPFFFLLMELQLGHLNQSSMSMLSLDFHEFLDEVSELNILEKNGTGRWLEFQANPMFGWFWDHGICKTGPFSCWRIPPSVFLPQFANDAKHGSPVRFTMEILVPKVPMERIHVQGFGLIGTSTYILIGNASDICDMVKTYGFWCFCVFAQKRIVISPIQKGFHRPMNLGIPFMMLGRPCSIWVPSNLTMAHDIWVRLNTSNWPIKINMGKFSIYTLW